VEKENNKREKLSQSRIPNKKSKNNIKLNQTA